MTNGPPGKETGALLHAPKTATARGYSRCEHNSSRVEYKATAQAGREMLWHALATQHLQRLRIIELLTEINRKLSVLANERRSAP
jgi:hypothetical protein